MQTGIHSLSSSNCELHNDKTNPYMDLHANAALCTGCWCCDNWNCISLFIIFHYHGAFYINFNIFVLQLLSSSFDLESLALHIATHTYTQHVFMYIMWKQATHLFHSSRLVSHYFRLQKESPQRAISLANTRLSSILCSAIQSSWRHYSSSRCALTIVMHSSFISLFDICAIRVVVIFIAALLWCRTSQINVFVVIQ